MLGVIDYIDEASVRGWAFDPSAPDDPLTIHVYLNEVELIAGPAGIQRPDVGARFKTSGNHGFNIKFPGQFQPHEARLFRLFMSNGREEKAFPKKKLSGSDARSRAWRETLRYLDDANAPMAVLDSDSLVSELVGDRRYKNVAWIGQEDLLSADILEKYYYLLMPKLVFEGEAIGIFLNRLRNHQGKAPSVFAEVELNESSQYAPRVNFHTSAGERSFAPVPSIDGLKNVILKGLTTRYVAKSSDVSSKSSMHIFRIDTKKQNILFVFGKTRAGKTSLSEDLFVSGSQYISLDVLVSELRAIALSDKKSYGKIGKLLKKEDFNLPEFYKHVAKSAGLSELCEEVAAVIRPEADTVLVEGAIINDAFVSQFRSIVGESARIWVLSAQ